MSFTYPKSRNFNAPSRMGTSGRTAAAYSLGKMGSGFGSISRIYNFCNSNTGDNNSAIQCVFGVQQQSTPGPGPTPPTPTPVLTTFFYSDNTSLETDQSTITRALYIVGGKNASDLVRVTVGTSCSSLGANCFADCSNLVSIEIPNSVTSLGNSCFFNCGLTSIEIPNSVTSLGNDCFSDSVNLTSITIHNSVTSIGAGCFAYTKILTLILPTNEEFTILPDNCFNGCEELTSITIPSSVTTIGNICFYKCYKLTLVRFVNPNNITADIQNMLLGITTHVTINFYNTANYSALDANVAIYFTETPPEGSDWTYNFQPGPP